MNFLIEFFNFKIKKFFSYLLFVFSKVLKKLSNSSFIISLAIYPWKSLNSLDKKLAKELPEILNKDSFYIEVGANNGINQSNTFFLESIYKSKGLLIEASQSNFEKCIKNRSKENIFEHCALVENSKEQEYVKLIFSDLMTIENTQSGLNPIEHAKSGLSYYDGINYEFYSPASTLGELLRKHNIKKVDLLSLDIEGRELEALKGALLEKKIIHNILVESRSIKKLSSYLYKFDYELRKRLSHHDYLFSLKRA